MMRTTIFGSSILSPPRKNEPRRHGSESRSVASARVSCRRALFRERERDFSPTNQLCTFLFEAFGKKEHPPRHNERNDTSENNNALNNLSSFSHHRKQPPRFQRRRRRRRRRKREREGPERRGFSVRFLIVQSSSRRRRRKDASASAEKPEKKREYDAENIPPVRARVAPKRVVVVRKRWWFCGDEECEQF